MKDNNKGRRKKGNKNNRDYWYNPETQQHEMKPHVRQHRSAAHQSAKSQKRDGAEREAKELKVGHAMEKEITIRRIPTGPCCGSPDEVATKNEQMLNELMRRPTWAFSQFSASPDVVVIQHWFRRKHKRHLAHFFEYLKLRGIRYTKG
ncbi:MAG: hypothetical protein ISP83_01695 [Candidatus Poseidonia sp.]|nr:hypothetical protein [Poseidonia sp.]MBL6748161.1 hypothetical protein [Poseidonia sp.]MBL6806508.1 hypothetical protein [Poseidonia sp.]MBL6884851.1 hypothetical protein [Candidatus Poseidoniaceae archaeon]MBL6886164.1 hypothetical protein [Poseidonia sp.]